MAANWKKIILENEPAHLNNITSSGTFTLGLPLEDSNLDDDVLVIDGSGNVRILDADDIGGQGTSVQTFVTMSVNSTATISSSVVNDTLVFATGSNGPLSLSSSQAEDNITFTVTTQSREDVEDVSSLFLSASNLGTEDIHEDITITYNDNGDDTPGTFSLTGSNSVGVSNTTGQAGVDLDFNQFFVPLGLFSLQASASGLTTTSSVIFKNITSSDTDPTVGGGNISQTTDLVVAPNNTNYNLPLGSADASLSPGDYISASAVHIDGNVGIENDLTMSGAFLFQGYGFSDQQVLTHSGSNTFGSGSMPAALDSHHQFTGSFSVTGSGITLQQSNSFSGDGSGLTNIPNTSIEGLGLLSGSTQILSEISGAFQFISPTLRTASLISGAVSAITSSFYGGFFASGYDGLVSSGQIQNFATVTSQSFKNFISNNYITDITTNNTSGITSSYAYVGLDTSSVLSLDIDRLTLENTLSGSDEIMFGHATSTGVVRKQPLTVLTGSVIINPTGTVTSVGAGNGIQVTNPTGYGTPGANPLGDVLSTTVDMVLSGSDVDSMFTLNPNDISLKSNVSGIGTLTAESASLGFLKVLDYATLGNATDTTTVNIHDNFILLNNDLDEDDTPIDDISAAAVGFTINRGNEVNANFFWNEPKKRWTVSRENLTEGTTAADHDSYVGIASFNSSPPSPPPIYSNLTTDSDGLYSTGGEGNIHVNTTSGAPEVWIWA